jgi:hypothetical protein
MRRDDPTPPAFEEDLRAMLHRAADAVDPDPAGWHRLQRRTHGRRAAVRTGRFVLAGGAAAVIAIAVISTAPDTADVELGPGVLASAPPAVTATTTPAPGATPSTRPAASDEAGAVLHTDGEWLRMTALDGSETTDLFPAPPGRSIADISVHPTSTTAHFDVAYRDVPADGCASTYVTSVDTRPDGAPTSGQPVEVWSGLEDVWCTDAPTFSEDGSRLAWFAHRGDTDRVLQSIEWTEAGLADPIVHTTPLVPGPFDEIEDARLVALSLPSTGAESGTRGTLLIRSGPAGQLLSIPVDVADDGRLSVDGDAAEAVTLDDVGGRVVDADGRWRAVALPTVDAEPLLGLAHAGDGGTLTAETPLFLDPLGGVHLDAIGDTAVLGLGPLGGAPPARPSAVLLARLTGDDASPTGIELVTDLPPATSATLLAAPAVDPEAPALPATPGDIGRADPAGPVPTLTPTAIPAAIPTPTSGPPSPTPTPEPPSTEVPEPVRDVAEAIRAGALDRDWDAVSAFIPGGGFTSNYGGETDHVAFYRQEEAKGVDVLGTLAGLLAEEPATEDGSIWVWPAAYLEEVYLGYRVGIRADGTWLFYVAGD